MYVTYTVFHEPLVYSYPLLFYSCPSTLALLRCRNIPFWFWTLSSHCIYLMASPVSGDLRKVISEPRRGAVLWRQLLLCHRVYSGWLCRPPADTRGPALLYFFIDFLFTHTTTSTTKTVAINVKVIMVWHKLLWKGDGEDRDGWKLRETTASAAAANWRDAHLQMLKGIRKGVNRGPKTKHMMTKIMLNMNVKSLIGVVSFRYSLRFHIESLMRSARMFATVHARGSRAKRCRIYSHAYRITEVSYYRALETYLFFLSPVIYVFLRPTTCECTRICLFSASTVEILNSDLPDSLPQVSYQSHHCTYVLIRLLYGIKDKLALFVILHLHYYIYYL